MIQAKPFVFIGLNIPCIQVDWQMNLEKKCTHSPWLPPAKPDRLVKN
jgi:hypothetical protein